MSLRVLPSSVRNHLYLFWLGAISAGLGIVGFFLAYGEVGSPKQATIDVHYDIPVLAYSAIAAWLVGLLLMWYSRRRLNAAVAAKLAENREAIYVDAGLEEASAGGDGPRAGREPMEGEL